MESEPVRMIKPLLEAGRFIRLTNTFCGKCQSPLWYCIECATGEDVNGKLVETQYPVWCWKCDPLNHFHGEGDPWYVQIQPRLSKSKLKEASLR